MTQAPSTVEALHWAKGVLGLNLDLSLLQNPHLTGLVHGAAVNAPPVRRAPQLTLSHIKRLEEIADSGWDTRDRVTAGAVLLGLFSCARASDLARATSLDIDLGPAEAVTVWIQASVPHSKTAIAGRARLARTRAAFPPTLVPLMAPRSRRPPPSD